LTEDEVETVPTVITSDMETVPLHIVIRKEGGIHEHLDIQFPVEFKVCKFVKDGKTYIIKRENIFLKKKGFIRKSNYFYTFFNEDGSPIVPPSIDISSRVLMSAAESQLLRKAMSEFWKKPFNYKWIIYIAVFMGVIGVVGYLLTSGMVKLF
jgi:hypothetical protein